MSEIIKICRKHGQLIKDQTRMEKNIIRCKQCRSETRKRIYYKDQENSIKKSVAWKKNNRDHYNAWVREDRKKNPEKYLSYERKSRKKSGSRRITLEIIRMHKLTLEKYEQMLKDSNNLCYICKKQETRKARTKGNICRLSVDHCYTCEDKGTYVVRGLLCHACNTGIGKFKDNIELLKNAINYLENHKHVA